MQLSDERPILPPRSARDPAWRPMMFPRRGAIALVTTAIALVLLFNFKTPDQVPVNDGVASTNGSISTSRNLAGSNASPRLATPTPAGSSSPGGGSSSGGGSSATATPSSGTRPTSDSQTLTGSIYSSRYGNTQV